MRDLLHKRIDQREALAEKSIAVVHETVTELLPTVLEHTTDFEEVMFVLAQAVADRLDPITTEAVHAGAAHAKSRAKLVAKGGSGEG